MSEAQGSSWRWVAWVVALAAVPRVVQAGLRWDEVALAYLAYTAPTADALAAGHLGDALSTWVGLHPPLHAVLMGIVEWAWPAPVLWLGLSLVASLSAVALMVRHAGLMAGVLMASSPLQILYAAEVNNYPLAVVSVAALLAGMGAPLGWFLAAVGLACWSHVLTAAAAGGAVVWRLWHTKDRGERVPLAVGSLALVAPVVAGAVRLSSGDGTFVQPAFDGVAWLGMVVDRVGWPSVVLAGVAALGLRGPALAVGLPLVGMIVLALVLGAAAPHQLPYLLLPLPVLAVGLSQVLRGRHWSIVAAVGALCAGQLVGVGWHQAQRVRAIVQDLHHERGVDVALAESRPGDVLWLVAPALQADDDKTDSSSVLWRLGVLSPMPMRRDVDLDYQDWRYGQPRAWRDRTIHTSTELDEQPLDHVVRGAWARGARVFVVLYDHAPATGLDTRVERAVRPWSPVVRRIPRSHGLGDDLIYTLSGTSP